MLTIDFNRLALTPGQLCLDIGCGEGRHSLAAYAYSVVYALGLDLSEQDLATAASRIADMQAHAPLGEIGFGAGDATRLPIADERVDVVIASEILEHIPDYLQGNAFLGKQKTEDPEYAYMFRGRMDERYDMSRAVRDQKYRYIRNYMPYRIYGQKLEYLWTMNES